MLVFGYVLGEILVIIVFEMFDFFVIENLDVKIILDMIKKILFVFGIFVMFVKVENSNIVGGDYFM